METTFLDEVRSLFVTIAPRNVVIKSCTTTIISNDRRPKETT